MKRQILSSNRQCSDRQGRSQLPTVQSGRKTSARKRVQPSATNGLMSRRDGRRRSIFRPTKDFAARRLRGPDFANGMPPFPPIRLTRPTISFGQMLHASRQTSPRQTPPVRIHPPYSYYHPPGVLFNGRGGHAQPLLPGRSRKPEGSTDGWTRSATGPSTTPQQWSTPAG
jgi:hypothetical protein